MTILPIDDYSLITEEPALFNEFYITLCRIRIYILLKRFKSVLSRDF